MCGWWRSAVCSSGSCFRAFSTTGGAGEEALEFDAKKSDNPDLDLAGGGGGLSEADRRSGAAKQDVRSSRRVFKFLALPACSL